MPEKEPLQAFTPLQFILESKLVFLVDMFEEIEELGGCLHDGEWRGLSVVNEDGNATLRQC